MGVDLVPGGGGLGRQGADPVEIDILDLAAARADQVGVRLRPDAVVAVAAVAELQLQHFADLLERVQRLIDGSQGGRRAGLLSMRDYSVVMRGRRRPAVEFS